MEYSDFTGEVQHRIEAATQGEAVRSIRAVLTTLGERIQEAEAAYQAQAIVAMLAEVTPGGEIQDLRDGLPDEFAALFEFVDADEVPW